MGMVHSGLLSLLAILKESANEDDSALSDGESSGFLIPWECNVVTSAIPITTTTTGGDPSALDHTSGTVVDHRTSVGHQTPL
jgi:hypothetical protein